MNIPVALVLLCACLAPLPLPAATESPIDGWTLAPPPEVRDFQAFPALLEAVRMETPAVEVRTGPNQATLAVELALVMGVTIALANALPRHRRRRRARQAARAAREMSWMRWTIARRPFDL